MGLPSKVCILDGWGENVNKDEWNAIHIAETPVTDGLRKHEGRWRTVQAHGKAVGLPSDAGKVQLSRSVFTFFVCPWLLEEPWLTNLLTADMGNSEVGHNAL